MALTKMDLIHAIHEELGFTKNKSSDILESMIEIIKSNLASGADVLISGFGKFCVREKCERKGRNPATGDDLTLRARRVVTFQCSGKLRKRVNGKE